MDKEEPIFEGKQWS